MEEAVVSFLKPEVFARYGLPHIIVTDNGSQFTINKLTSFLEECGVLLKYASVSHPQSNGQDEAANKIILNTLKKKLQGKKGSWADELPNVLWAHRTTPSTITGETPYALAFGTEAVTPVEIAYPTARVSNAMITPPEELGQWSKENGEALCDDLDNLDERRQRAARRVEKQKKRAEKHFNRRVRPRKFQKGNLVLLKLEAVGRREGKLSPTWEGPYVVIEEVGSNAYRLQDHDGRELPRPWNADNLKFYYA